MPNSTIPPMKIAIEVARSSRVAWGAIAMSILLCSCSTTPAPTADRLPSAEQIAGRVRAIEVDQVYAEKGGIYLKYQGSIPGTTRPAQLYAQARWVPEDGDEVVHAPLQALPLQFQAETDWKAKPEGLPSVSVYDGDDFRRLRTETRRAATSREKGTGIAVTVGEEELFIYYDEHGQLRSSLPENKPPDFRIAKAYSRKEYAEVILRTTQDYLASLDNPARQVLFVTGEQGYYAWPFFYVDLDRHLAVPLVLAPPTQAERGAAASYQLRIAQHVIVDSPILSALRNPVSSLDRLFHLMLTNVYDTMRPIPGVEDSVIPPLSTGRGMDLDAWEERLDDLVGSPASSGTIRFLIDGDKFAPKVHDAIRRAEDSVHLRVFVFDNDDHGVELADLLKRRSEEVDVRVLVDGLGTFGAAMHNPPSMPQDFQPPASIVNYLEQESEVRVRVQTNPFFATDHTKTLVVDHTVAFTGGLNVGREYRYEWHDLGMEVHGPVVDVIRKEFHKRWHHSGPLGDLGYLFHVMKPTKPHALAEGMAYPIRVLQTKPGTYEIYHTQVEAIRAAKRYVYIENPYFSNELILQELIRARRRGVDVRVILPFHGDVPVMNKNNVMQANRMFRNGIRVFVYPSMSHAKAAIYDGWACMGSANLDKLSLRDNYELNLATSHPEAVQALKAQLFTPDFEHAVEMTEPFPTDWTDYLASILAKRL